MVEQQSPKLRVVGSNPTTPAKIKIRSNPNFLFHNFYI